MRCRQARQLLSPYIDDELGAREKQKLEEHLAACPACREELEELQGISCILQDIGRQIKAPDDLVPKAMARIRAGIAKGDISPLGGGGDGQVATPAAFAGKVLARTPQDAGRHDCGDGPAARRPGWTKYLAAAAAVAVLCGGTLALAWQYGVGGAPGSSVAVITPPAVTEQPGGSEGTAVSPPETAATAPGSMAGGPEGQPAGVPAPGNEGLEASEPGQVTAAKGAAGDDRDQEPGVAGGGPPAPNAGAMTARAEPEAAPEAVATGEPAAQAQSAQPPRAFLSATRHTRSTLLELGVDDLAAARQAVQALARGRGGEVSSVTRVAAGEEIVRLVVPVETAGRLLGDLEKLGRVLDKGTQEKDITAEFNRKLAEYQELAGQESVTESDAALLASLESQLTAWDKESVEAGKEVVTVWLKAGK